MALGHTRTSALGKILSLDTTWVWMSITWSTSVLIQTNNPEGGMCDPPMFMDSFTIPWSDRRKLEFKRSSWSELQDLSHLDPSIIVKENT